MTGLITGQLSESAVILDGANANGSSAKVMLRGMKTVYVEIQKTGTGTCTALIEGSFDGSVWYAIGQEQLDATASPARSVSAITIGATNPLNHFYQVLDLTKYLRVTLASSAGSYSLTATVFALPF